MNKIVLLSNPICVDEYHCNTLVIAYSDVKSVFGFEYPESPEGFMQQCRIPATLRNVKHPSDSTVYQKTSGSFYISAARNNKNRLLVTDWMDETFTDALSDARFHRNLTLDGVQYSGHGEFNEEENDFDNLTQVTLQVFEQNYNHSNISC